jgi:hypothetical protein
MQNTKLAETDKILLTDAIYLSVNLGLFSYSLHVGISVGCPNIVKNSLFRWCLQ